MEDLDMDVDDTPKRRSAARRAKRRPAAHAQPESRAVRDGEWELLDRPAAHARPEGRAARGGGGGAAPAPQKRPAAKQSEGRTKKQRREARSITSFQELAAHEDAAPPRAPVWPREWKPPLTVGSDCAGLVTEDLALDLLHFEHKHLFVTEEDRDVRHLIYHVLRDQDPKYYKNVLLRDVTELPRVDLYVFGFPCQPFSPAGKRLGLEDPRAQVLFHCLDYVRCHRPPIVVLENSHRFVETKEGIIGLLQQWGYVVHWKILNTNEQGLPQSRPRFYLVALRVDISSPRPTSFTWPRDIGHIPLSELLDPAGVTRTGVVPARIHGRKQEVLEQGRQSLITTGRDPDRELCVIDLSSSLNWSSAMHECSPCLTASRCKTGGFYMTKVERMMTVAEMCRLQGIPDGRFDFEWAGVTRPKFLHAVGNAMTSTVLARVLSQVLYAVKLTTELPPGREDFKELLCSA